MTSIQKLEKITDVFIRETGRAVTSMNHMVDNSYAFFPRGFLGSEVGKVALRLQQLIYRGSRFAEKLPKRLSKKVLGYVGTAERTYRDYEMAGGLI